jgi:hypothetical protein
MLNFSTIGELFNDATASKWGSFVHAANENRYTKNTLDELGAGGNYLR